MLPTPCRLGPVICRYPITYVRESDMVQTILDSHAVPTPTVQHPNDEVPPVHRVHPSPATLVHVPIVWPLALLTALWQYEIRILRSARPLSWDNYHLPANVDASHTLNRTAIAL